MSCSFIIALFHNMYLYLRIVLDRILYTKREASTASRLFNMSCMAQTKCRNKLSPQIVQAIRELGLDFVITGQASSIRQRRQDKQTKGNNLMQVTQSTVNITLCSFRTFRSKLMTCLRCVLRMRLDCLLGTVSDKVSEQVLSSNRRSNQRAGIRFCHHLQGKINSNSLPPQSQFLLSTRQVQQRSDHYSSQVYSTRVSSEEV